MQGLVLLNDLTAVGISALLVTDSELGSGQTLHSHGLLNSGVGLVTGEFQDDLSKHVIPRMRRLGVPVYGNTASYLALPAPAIEQLRPIWEQRDYRPVPAPATDLPTGLTSPLEILRVPGYHIPKRALVERLAHGVKNQIIRGRVTVFDDDGVRIEQQIKQQPDQQTDEQTGQETVSFRIRPQATVLAAGCGTKRLVTDVLDLSNEVTSRITYSVNHMLCLRSPLGVLPAIGTVMTPGVMVAGHVNRHHETVGHDDTVSWYVTPPVDGSARPSDAPNDASAATSVGVVAEAVAGVRSLFGDLDWSDQRIEATVFAGTKQDIDGQPTQRLVDVCDPDRRIMVALPSVMANTFANSLDVLRRLPDLGVRPTGGQAHWPGSAVTEVGNVPELTPAVAWRPFDDFIAAAPS